MSRFNHMTDEEILHQYRNANVKKQMVQVLADRNCVDKKEIIEFLYEQNVLEATAIGAYRRRGMLPPEARKTQIKKGAKPVEFKAEPIQPVQIPDSVIEAVNKQLEGMEVDYCEAKAVIKEAEEIIRKYEELLNFLEHSKPCASCEI